MQSVAAAPQWQERAHVGGKVPHVRVSLKILNVRVRQRYPLLFFFPNCTKAIIKPLVESEQSKGQLSFPYKVQGTVDALEHMYIRAVGRCTFSTWPSSWLPQQLQALDP